MAAKISPTTII